MLIESSYDCPQCGEDIVIPVDPSLGRDQEYVEDCPVCCCPILLHVWIDDQGEASVRGEAE
ncbi:MAG: hypothetical protein ACI8QS_000875 [Planctomycetota bacterium]|jgi:hypothetical protein